MLLLCCIEFSIDNDSFYVHLDIDECKLETTPCDQDCINRNGSFQCTCRPGFALSADRTTCSSTYIFRF